MNRWTCGLLAAALAIAFTVSASGQQAAPQGEPPSQPARKAKKPRANQPPPELSEEDQLSPRQLEQRAPRPARQTQPAAPPPAESEPAASAQPAAQAAPSAAGSRAIACSGPFGKQSSHLKLAQRFDSRNITFTEVDGPEGTKLRASVLFPNDPKRRLEILWQNEGSRSDTHLIVINGQSTWSAPKGLRLGLTLPALEKLNGKPFRLKGFDHDAAGQVTDWQGGALEKLPGDCRLGIRFAVDPKSPADKRSEVAGDKDFASSDAAMRAVAPKVSEIILGY